MAGPPCRTCRSSVVHGSVEMGGTVPPGAVDVDPGVSPGAALGDGEPGTADGVIDGAVPVEDRKPPGRKPATRVMINAAASVVARAGIPAGKVHRFGRLSSAPSIRMPSPRGATPGSMV